MLENIERRYIVSKNIQIFRLKDTVWFNKCLAELLFWKWTFRIYFIFQPHLTNVYALLGSGSARSLTITPIATFSYTMQMYTVLAYRSARSCWRTWSYRSNRSNWLYRTVWSNRISRTYRTTWTKRTVWTTWKLGHSRQCRLTLLVNFLLPRDVLSTSFGFHVLTISCNGWFGYNSPEKFRPARRLYYISDS